MAWLGARVILTEYALGIILPFILGLVSIRSGFFGLSRNVWEAVLGSWLITIGVNCIPLFIHAFLIARAGTIKQEGEPELARARRYGVQQVVILIPFLVVILALAQEGRRRQTGH